MRIIGLNGRKGSGKSAAGDILWREHGYERVGFAGLLKASASALFGVEPEVWDEHKNIGTSTVALMDNGDIISEWTVREFLQRYGTEAHRDIFGNNFWVDAIEQKFQSEHGEYWQDGDGKYVITDVRFPNELQAVHVWGGINIRIERPGTDFLDSHASESDPDPFLVDALIENYGTLADLEKQIAGMLVYMEAGRRILR